MKTVIVYALAVAGCTVVVAGTQAWLSGMLTTHEVLMGLSLLLPVAAYRILMKA